MRDITNGRTGVTTTKRRVARDAGKPPRLLTPRWHKAIHELVFRTDSRDQLDALTRMIWHRYGGNPRNAAALEQLKIIIRSRRHGLFDPRRSVP